MFLLPASWINQQSANLFLSDPKVVLQIISYFLCFYCGEEPNPAPGFYLFLSFVD